MNISTIENILLISISAGLCVSLGLFVTSDMSNIKPKWKIIFNVISIAITLYVVAISIYTVVATESYIRYAENENNAILSTKSNCSVTNVHTYINYYNSSVAYIVSYIHPNVNEYYYIGVCDVPSKCWPNVNDSITCWPNMDNSVIVYYSINPPLLDVPYFKSFFILTIVVLVLVVLFAIMLIAIYYSRIKENYEKYKRGRLV